MQHTKPTQQQKQTKVEFHQAPLVRVVPGGDLLRGGTRGARGGRGQAGAGRGDSTPAT